ncbi:hypothetical protein CONCODRAFT_9327 [Conidiobolus coronatus NRRL 28638]|uniref:Uncharacterized protein n=1 Tax=Conidiobolus coronatus (strain ATCC 28846 / CBS 209.66 / NRRL 28638) TaxID=796925 RepID=A0A137P071_CONC2|nr:hypothetical protein CONCODRAFT_9327 [Conidiobolus coronatus NRRL 28638]|eukprot:KXN68435.1 hypothetical protein CONCODRAFT_9327 [Conidiobolus coronatus NRRL 28638]
MPRRLKEDSIKNKLNLTMSEKEVVKMGVEILFIAVVVPIGAIILFYNIIMFVSSKQRNRSRNQSTHVHLHISNTNLSPNNQIPNRQTNNNLSPEFLDPLPLYTPPINPSHVQMQIPTNEPSSIQIQVHRPNNELIDRPPTYRV